MRALVSRPCGARLSAHAWRRRRAGTPPPRASTAPFTAADSSEGLIGIVFDMDGTLTKSSINFAAMRERTGIPAGDLFAVMQNWKTEDGRDDSERVRRAFAVIHELEEAASASVELQPGVEALLEHVVACNLRLALVTRNTPAATDAFFAKLGEQLWRPRFSPLLTRHFAFVKPDRRLLQHVATAWGCAPSRLLMVGDSVEDIELGASVGAPTCLLAGGGNETAAPSGGTPSVPAPTLVVSSLAELGERMRAGFYWSPASSALPPGVAFVDFLFAQGFLAAASCSYPALGDAARGMAFCTAPGCSVLHLDCGDGALTKTVASHGVAALGADADAAAVALARRRGLAGLDCGPGAAGGGLASLPAGSFDAVLCCAPGRAARPDSLLLAPSGWALRPAALRAAARLLRPGGVLAVEWARGDAGLSPSGAGAQLSAPGSGFNLRWCRSTATGAARLVAVRDDDGDVA